MDYLIRESEYNSHFAGIIGTESHSENMTDLTKKAELAVKEEFCYKTVSMIEGTLENFSGDIQMDLVCITEDDEEELRIITLDQTAIYKL